VATGRLTASAAAFREVASVAPLRRVLGGWLLFNAAQWAIWVAVLVYAYEATGPESVGFVAVAQLVPAAVAAPRTARLADRMRPGRALSLAYAVIALLMLATGAAMLLALPPLVVYVLAASVVVAYTSVRPIQSSILPLLVGRAEQLTAANALSTIFEGAGVLIGPLLCGALIAIASPGTVYLAAGGATAASALLVLAIRTESPRPAVAVVTAQASAASAPVEVVAVPEPPAELPRPPSGWRTIRADPGRLLTIVLLAVRFGVAAAMDVLLVLAAIELLAMGPSGAGYLSAAIGLGWVVGGATTLVVVGRPRLAPLMVVGSVLWAIPVVAVGLLAQPGPALVLLVVAGIGLAVADVAVRTVLQRLVPIPHLASVFGIAEGASMAGAAIGALVAAVADATVGVVGAIALAGVVLPVVAAAILPTVARSEAAVPIPFREIALLRRLPLFAPVPAPALETAAATLTRSALPAGAVVIREGDVGDRFYVVDSGTVRVEQQGVVIGELGPGDGFGELALIRDIPRTASVVATSDVALLALDRPSFLLAVTSSARAAAEAARVAAGYLDRDRQVPGDIPSA
jgi:MFS family permease